MKRSHMRIWLHSWEVLLDLSVMKSNSTSHFTVLDADYMSQTRTKKEKSSIGGCSVAHWFVVLNARPFASFPNIALLRGSGTIYWLCSLLASLDPGHLYNIINKRLWCQASTRFTVVPPAGLHPIFLIQKERSSVAYWLVASLVKRWRK